MGLNITSPIPATNTTTTPALNYPVSGAVVKTSPVAGDMEVDANGIPYYTHATSERGLIDCEQFIILSSAYTLASQTAAQKMFNAPANGAVTVASAKTYQFECHCSLTAMSASSGSYGFALGGTATLGSQMWFAQANKVAFTGGAWTASFNTAANVSLVAANTTTTGQMYLRGTIRVTTGGTLIPQVSLGVAAAAIVGLNSYFRIWAIGSNTVQSVGNWS